MDGVWNPDNFKSLTPEQRAAVDARRAEDETGPDYLNRIGAGVAAIDSYVVEDERRDSETFAPFYRLSLRLTSELRMKRALEVREDARALGLDTSEVDKIIAGFGEG